MSVNAPVQSKGYSLNMPWLLKTAFNQSVRADRAWDNSANKFPGDYREVAAQRSDLTDGSFVSVECEPTSAGCRAVKLTVIRGDKPA